MPNWCNNQITISAPKEKMDKFETFLNESDGKNWFDFFLPIPEELKDTTASLSTEQNQELVEKYGASDWYSWSLDNWGCKWNCDAQDWSRDGDSILFWFDSPWGPPTELYSFIFNDTDFDVEAGYHEEGMSFVGRYEDGIDESYEYSDLESLDNIPNDIVDNWNLNEIVADRAEWEKEDEEEELFDENKENVR